MARFITLGKMFGNVNKTYRVSRSVIKNNDINILILDERWNGLFAGKQKPEEIVLLEDELKQLLKGRANLIAEQKECLEQKKILLKNTIEITTKNLNKKSKQNKKDVKNSWKKIGSINNTLQRIETELKEIPYEIRRANHKLLECMVNTVYISYRALQRKREELDALIKITQEKLEYYSRERTQIEDEGNKTYEYFHDLLGPEELQKLDEQYFAGRKEVTR